MNSLLLRSLLFVWNTITKIAHKHTHTLIDTKREYNTLGQVNAGKRNLRNGGGDVGRVDSGIKQKTYLCFHARHSTLRKKKLQFNGKTILRVDLFAHYCCHYYYFFSETVNCQWQQHHSANIQSTQTQWKLFVPKGGMGERGRRKVLCIFSFARNLINVEC